ncbi:MAG: hypothetical protein SNJ84_04190 [Verrucomicrobiia bacterium]
MRIYIIQRSAGYPQFNVAWQKAGRRKIKAFAKKLVSGSPLSEVARNDAHESGYPHSGGRGTCKKADKARSHENAETVWSNRKDHPTVSECKRWVDAAHVIGESILQAADGNSKRGPE